MSDSARTGSAMRRFSEITGWLIAILVSGLVLAELVALACRPQPERGWYAAALVASARRVAAGGPLYPDPHDSLLPPATPYGPAMPLVVAAVDAMAPQWTDRAPRVLGIAAVGAMAAGLAVGARRMGAGWFEAVGGTALVLALLVTDWEFRKFLELGPDLVVLAALFGMMALVDSVRIHPGGWARPAALGALVFLACLTKQSGLVVSVGLIFYVLAMGDGRRKDGKRAETDPSSPDGVESDAPRGARRRLVGAMGFGVTAAVGFLAACPGAIPHTTVVMAKHPYRPIAEWVIPSIDYLAHVLWPLVALGGAGLAVALRRRPAQFGIVLAVGLPLAVVQVLARFKAGGTNSNWIAPTLALLPIGLTALTRDVRRPFRHAALTAAMLVAALPLAVDLHKLADNLPAERASFSRKVAFLAKRFPRSRVLASGNHYRLLHRAGMELETDSTVLLHYRMAGVRTPAVEQAIVLRQYDLILLDANNRGMDRPLLQGIHANYREVRLPPSAPFDTILVPRPRGEDKTPRGG